MSKTISLLRSYLLIPIALGFPPHGFAQPNVGDTVNTVYKVPPQDGEFRQSTSLGSPMIGCIKFVAAGEAPPKDPNYSHCLRLGQIKIGMQLHELQFFLFKLKTIPEKYIINPHIVSKSPDGIITALFPIATTPSEKGIRLKSYLVSTLSSYGEVLSLQITGTPNDSSRPLHFSGIALGTPKELVIDTLGNPSSTRRVPEINGVLWSYAPFPFTIEFVDNIVYSIRMEAVNPNDFVKAFTPLATIPD
jgi:hypothetical protein